MPEKQVYGDLNLNSNKVIGLAAAAAVGQAVRYDEFNELVRKKGDSNLFLGKDSGNAAMSSTDNICVGQNSGNAITSGDSNVLIGSNAGLNATSIVDSIGIGKNVFGTGVLTGGQNTFVGNESGLIITSGSLNTSLGYGCGPLLTTGAENVLLGRTAGNSLVTGDSNVFIGSNSGYNVTGSDLFYLQNGTSQSSILMHGDFDAGKLAIGKTMALVAKLNVNGAIAMLNLSADPVLTENGTGAIWISDGTGSGSTGDLMYSERTGGVTTAHIVQAA